MKKYSVYSESKIERISFIKTSIFAILPGALIKSNPKPAQIQIEFDHLIVWAINYKTIYNILQ